MKNILAPLMIVLLLMTACIPVLTPTESKTNEPPVAYIDSISSSRVFEGEKVIFSGHGVDTDGYIVAYSWRSSLDGVLSTEASFETSSLSTGRNTIYFKVQDDGGEWSREKYQYITVIPEGTAKPIINRFDSSPNSIMKGESAVLTWDVSGAEIVSISPGIGDVSKSGSRTVYPEASIRYTLTASNDAGDSTLQVEVKIISGTATAIETYAIPGESGNLDYYKNIGLNPIAGFDTQSSYPYEAFLSFDISMIPKGALVKSVSLDLTNMKTIGDPFTWLGAMAVFYHQYGTLDRTDYVNKENISGGFPRGALVTSYTRPLEPYSSEVITETIQNLVDKGESRFQVRIQFEIVMLQYRSNINVVFIPEVTKLTVKY